MVVDEWRRNGFMNIEVCIATQIFYSALDMSAQFPRKPIAVGHLLNAVMLIK